MQYISLGDTDEIAASCHLVTFGGTGIVLDAGMDPNADGWAAVPPFELLRDRDVDHAIVTHAHHDHLGSLPVLMKEVPHARVHMSKPTVMLAEMLLPSSARLQKRRVKEGSASGSPAYDVEMAEALSFVYEAHNLEAPFGLEGLHAEGELTCTFFHASHVLGAVGVLFEGQDDGEHRSLFYTSDTHLGDQTILPGADFPEGTVDVLMLESTLGADPDAETSSRKEQEKAFAASLKRVIDRGGSALVPVFALGRSQDMLALVHRFKKRGLIPADTPVYTAGAMRGIAAIYDDTRNSTPRLDSDFEVYGVDQARLPRGGKKMDDALAKPGIYVVTSGMLFERTPSHSVAQHLLEDEKNGVFFVGYSKEGSPGARLLEAAEKGEQIVLDEDRGAQTIRCDVERFRFSGHAHRRDLLKVVDMLKPETVVLVHGETEAKEWMRDHIESEHPDVRVIIPGQGEEIEV